MPSRTSRRSAPSAGACAGSSARASSPRCASPRSRSPGRRRPAEPMGVRDGGGEELTVWVDADGSISVDVGARFVVVGEDDFERILDRVAADGGGVRLLGGSGRADDGDEPADHESDPAMAAAGYVRALAHRRGLTVTAEA